MELEEYRAFLKWLNTKQQKRLAACKIILDCPANFTEHSDLMCVANLQRRPYPPFQPGLVYDELGELEVWDAVKESQKTN